MPVSISPPYIEENTFDRLERNTSFYEKAPYRNRMFLNDLAMQDTNAFYVSDQFRDRKLDFGIKDET